MKQAPFEASCKKDWNLFSKELENIKKGKKSLHFPSLYRKISHHLALAIDRGYSVQLVQTIQNMVFQGHEQLYKNSRISQHRLTQYYTQIFPQAVRRYRIHVIISLLAFIGPALITYFTLLAYPHYAYAILDDTQLQQLADMYDPVGRIGAVNQSDSQLQMWGFYIYNNVGIDFKCYASGFLLGVGSLFFMTYNGLFLGTATSYIHELGYQDTFYSFVIGHSALEITAMILSGASGMILGQALLFPGRKTRLRALQHGAREGMSILMGAGTMTFLAAFIEAFWSSRVDVSHTVKYIMGSSQWILVFSYFIWMGRKSDAA